MSTAGELLVHPTQPQVTKIGHDANRHRRSQRRYDDTLFKGEYHGVVSDISYFVRSGLHRAARWIEASRTHHEHVDAAQAFWDNEAERHVGHVALAPAVEPPETQV